MVDVPQMLSANVGQVAPRQEWEVAQMPSSKAEVSQSRFAWEEEEGAEEEAFPK
jgi:hypothetical protein